MAVACIPARDLGRGFVGSDGAGTTPVYGCVDSAWPMGNRYSQARHG